MALRTMTLIAVLALIGVTVAAAQTTDATGRIERIDPDQHVIVLSDGRMYRLTPNTVIYVDRQPVTLSALTPGQTVVIRSGESLAVTQAPGAPQVVITPPATVTPAGVRQTFYARVRKVDDDGTVRIDTGRDSFKVQMSRDLVRQIREGDTVQLDVTVVPAGTPAASPRSR